MELSPLIFLLVLFLLALAYANGTNDVSKAIATLVGSGVTHYRAAILWGTIWTMVGAGLSGIAASAMVKTLLVSPASFWVWTRSIGSQAAWPHWPAG